MNWHCEACGHMGSVGLVVGLRPGNEASCPCCDQKMSVESALEVASTEAEPAATLVYNCPV